MNKIREILKGIDQEDSVEGGYRPKSSGIVMCNPPKRVIEI